MRRAVVAALVLAALLAPAAPAPAAHDGNPNFLSEVDSVSPATQGVTVEVLNRDDRLLLHNTSGEDVVVEGYDDEPYARVRADGTVEVNTNSEAYYLNDDRFADVDVPADLGSAPAWKRIDRTGRFEWHDHRMHWMARTTPPQVTDESVRTKIFDCAIPIEVGGRSGAIAGTLTWTPLPGGGPPFAAIAAGAAIIIACCILVAVVRHRRRAGGERSAGTEAEAW